MKKFIEIYEDVAPKFLIDSVEDLVLNQDHIPFYYKKNVSGPQTTKDFPGISSPIFYNTTATEYYSFLSQIFYSFCLNNNIIIRNILVSRLFLTFPHPNPQNTKHIHTDLKTPHWVALYYINDSDGDTIFYDNFNNEIKRISPKKGTMVFFDGSIHHSGSLPTKKVRAIINTNFIGEKF